MNRIHKILTLLFLTILSFNAESSDNSNDISCRQALQYLEDSTGKLSIDDISKQDQALSGRWTTAPACKTLNFGISHSVFWVRYSLNIPENYNTKYYLIVKSSVIDYLDIYTGTEKSHETYLVGDRRPFSNRPVHFRQFVVPVSPDMIRNNSDIYMRVASYDGVHESVPIRIITETELKDLQTLGIFHSGLFYGLLIFMMVLSIALSFILRDKSQILFVAFVVFFGFWSLVFNGFADMFIWPNTPVSNMVLMFCVHAFGTFMAWFTVEFLSLRKISTFLSRMIKIVIFIMFVVSMPLILLDHYRLFFIEYMIMILVIILLIQVATVICLLRKTTESYFYVCSWFLNFIGTFFYIGKVFGFLPSTFLTENIFQIGIIFQSIVLLIGIIVRIYAIQKKANQDLETVIEKRTAELRQANEKLHELSMKDPLTGLYNRRYFLDQFTLATKIQDRSNHFLSILIMDVDFFKQFNDRYGHLEGDHCLQKIADIIYKSLPRKSDFCARYGGEEFIVCLPGTDIRGANVVAERIRTNVQDLGISHEKSPIAGVVTISIGVCDTSEKHGWILEHLIKKADEALYLAKKSGRNQVRQYSLTE